jgi:hypothetical protein
MDLLSQERGRSFYLLPDIKTAQNGKIFSLSKLGYGCDL